MSISIKKIALCATIATMSAFAGDQISGAGATFPAPLYFDWAHSYQKETSNQVNYQSIGSGGGVKQVQAGTVDFGGTDEPMKPDALAKANLLQFPAVIGTIDLVYNLPEVKDQSLKISNAAASGIFMGTIKTWNDPVIAKDNPGVKLPATPITVVHRSDGSGTTFNFTYWLSAISADWKGKVGTGKDVNWPAGLGGKGNEGVAAVVKQTPGAVGYVESAYAKLNKMSRVQLQTKDGNFIPWTLEAAKAAAANATWTAQDNFYEILVNMPGKNSWPITAATFILMPKAKVEKDKQVTKFFAYGFSPVGDKAAEKLEYIPLPDNVIKMVTDYWKANNVQP